MTLRPWDVGQIEPASGRKGLIDAALKGGLRGEIGGPDRVQIDARITGSGAAAVVAGAGKSAAHSVGLPPTASMNAKKNNDFNVLRMRGAGSR